MNFDNNKFNFIHAVHDLMLCLVDDQLIDE